MNSFARLHSSLEPLESRIAPAVIIATGDFDSDGATTDVRITGSSGSERILIEDSNTATKLSIDANADGDFTDPVDQIRTLAFGATYFDINLKAGNDVVTLSQTANYSNKTKAFFIRLGSGNNAVNFLSNGNIMNPGTVFRMDIQGGAQNDVLNLNFDDIGGSTVALTGNLGGGSDTSRLLGAKVGGRLNFDGFIGDSSVFVDLDLGSGSNVFTVDNDALAGFFGVIPSTVDIHLTGSPIAKDRDSITILNSGGVDVTSYVHIGVELGAGHDTFRGIVQFNSLRLVNSDNVTAIGIYSLDVNGGAGNDRLELTRNNSTGDVVLDGVLDLQLRGGAGNDTLIADLGDEAGLATFSTDSGNGLQRRLRFVADGGAGDDIFNLKFASDASATFTYDLFARGGAGDDVFTFLGDANNGSPSFGPAGAAVLDGGLGDDLFNTDVSGGFLLKRFT